MLRVRVPGFLVPIGFGALATADGFATGGIFLAVVTAACALIGLAGHSAARARGAIPSMSEPTARQCGPP